MRNVSLKSEQKVLLTVVGLIIAYFVGQTLLALFQSYVLPLISLGQDEVIGFLSIASAIPLKVKALKYPISLVDYVAETSGRKSKGIILGTDNGKMDRAMWYIACHPHFSQIGIFSSASGYSKELKRPVYLVKPEYCINRTDAQIVEFVQSFLNTAMTKELLEQANEKMATKDAIKEAEKAAKQANKATKGKPVNTIAETVAKLDIALERGLITNEEHKAKLAAALGI